MPDILIRNLANEDLALLAEQAGRLGLSRAEYLRRELEQLARRSRKSVTQADLDRLADVCADLDDEAVMRRAWS